MSDRSAPSILYVDDDHTNRHSLTWVLQQAGFRTREAATGGEALRLAADKPDLIILDVNLPDMDGFEVCRRIKAHPATAAIPVLHMSGVFVRSSDKAHGLEGGADGYLIKPVEPQEVVATVRSLLRIRRAEEAARTAAGQWQATFDGIHEPLWLLDAEGRVLRCNQAMADLLGRPVSALLGRPYRSLLRETLGGDAGPLTALLQESPPRRAGEVLLGGRWFRVTADPVPGERGEAAGRVHLLADVSERRRLEEQLRQAQKMEAVGRLAGGVAHDFNNLLTAITGNLTLLLREVSDDDPRREWLVATEQVAWRAADLTRQLLGFARQARPRLQPLDLGPCLRETLALLRRAVDPRVEFEARAAADLWLVQADPGQMSQVVMNLCLNARDAMPQGGRLAAEVGNVVLGAAGAPAPAEGRPGEFVRLRVSDNGSGILPEVRPHIFDPFFTTKEHGRGTGLGLAVVFGIVQQHQGWIECRSAAGEGTCFDVYLPRHHPAPGPPQPPAASEV
jgi:PAS domain S-box-containing protein